MNLDGLVNSLLANARRQSPSDHVPYAFEQRIMARLRELRPNDRLTVWTAGLWRAALSSIAVAAVLIGVDAMAPDNDQEALTPDQLEAAVVASVDPVSEMGNW